MKKNISTWLVSVFMVLGLLTLSMCGSQGAAPEETGVAVELTAVEEEALSEEFALEALETIDETNAAAEAEKLAAEIEADK